jgi:SAM-dependent methyltransferase
MGESSVTRGNGILEGFLSDIRSKKADSLIPDELRSGMILDVGCGNYPNFLHKVKFSGKHGLDRIHDSTQHAIANSDGSIELKNYDIEQEERLPYNDNMFEIVTMLAVYEHIEPSRLPSLMNEIHRVLKPGGFYILTTPAAWTDRLLRFLAKIGIVSSEEIDEHKDAYTFAKIQGIFDKSQFQGCQVRYGYFELFMNLYAIIEKV